MAKTSNPKKRGFILFHDSSRLIIRYKNYTCHVKSVAYFWASRRQNGLNEPLRSARMIITLANQKGGVGKTTMVLLLANWLAKEGHRVLVLDADRQQSVVSQRQSDEKNFPNESFPYDVLRMSLEGSQEELFRTLEELDNNNPGLYILIDTPGNLSENGLVPCLLQAKVIICPFQFERKSLDSTGTFIVVLQRLLESARRNTWCPHTIFVPNCVKLGTGTKEERKAFEQVQETFSQFGLVAPYIKELMSIKRVNSFRLFKEQLDSVEQCFGFIEEVCQKSC